MDNKQSRVKYLDGFRGLAILLVLVFHSYARWKDYYSFGHEFTDNPFFNLGKTGVWVFFVISGFVITMSLERCKDFGQFIFKRWLRMFPAMLVATVLIFTLNSFFPLRIEGPPRWTDMIGGLSFVSPKILNQYFGLDLRDIEGSYWSLYQEVFFYFIFGTFYFSIKKKYAIFAIFVLALSGDILIANLHNPIIFEFLRIYMLCGLDHYYLFLIGILLYEYFSSKKDIYFILAIFAFLFASGRFIEGMAPIISIGLVIISVRVELVQKIFNMKFFQYFGVISYPLYLFHENFIVTTTKIIAGIFPAIPHLLLPLGPIICAAIIASIIEKTEKPIKKYIEKNAENFMQLFKLKLQKV